MKTVITDNSLCVLPIAESAAPENIFNYIQALSRAGIKYVELDFRTVMKMKELPDGVKYILRLCDPMFIKLTEAFDFSYVLVTVSDLKNKIKTDCPVILECPAVFNLLRQLAALAKSQIDGEISMVRIRGNFPYMKHEEMGALILALKNSTSFPIDICPMNGKKTALDTAIKCTLGSVDNLTMCMGLPQNYASIEEYFFTLISVYEVFLNEYNIPAICRAAVYHRMVFGKKSGDSISFIMRMLDRDINYLLNADTGEKVRMRIALKERFIMKRAYVSALEKLIESEEFPEEITEEIYGAVRRFDASVFDFDEIYGGEEKLLN